jgi:pimeloyl-ACP methyl ester carboxylesterase
MRRARIPIIMALILSLGIVAGYFVSEGLREGMGTPQPTQMPLEWSYIIIAAREIPRGARIESDDVVQAPFPADMLVETMQTDTREVVGLWALQDIGRGCPSLKAYTRVRRDTVANSEDICSPTSSDGQRACPPVGDSSAPRFEDRPCNEVFPNDEDILQWETETSPLSIYLGDLPPGLDPPIRFGQTTCGLVNVPSNHASPGGPTISLAVLILPSTGTNPEPDPLFWAQGGPGGSTVSDLKWLAHDSPLRVHRDMVLFDQRGTGNSVPSLDCPEWETSAVSASENDLTQQEAERIQLEAVSACRRRLQGAGVMLSDFNTRENAADVEGPPGLGYDKVNLYGVSYGTELALNFMRSFPTSLRSAILDSVVPPQVNVETEAYRSFDHALTELFDACRADSECRQAYPNLEQTYTDLSARLAAGPVALRSVDPVKRRSLG